MKNEPICTVTISFQKNFGKTCFFWRRNATFATAFLKNSILNSFNHTQIMRKADLVSRVADSTGVAKVDVLVTVEAMFKEVRESLALGENVYVRGFGSFVIKKRAKKVGRNIQANTSVVIPEHNIPSFRPAKTFVERVKKSVLVTEEPAKAKKPRGKKKA